MAETATTDPVGFVTLTASKKSTSAGEINYLSLPLTRPVAFRGLVASASGNILTFQAGTFTSGQFSGPHYVELQSTAGGNFNGVVSDIASATTDALTLSDDYAGAVIPGTTIAIIRPHWTFASAFGIPSAFQGGANAASADVLTIVDPTAIDVNERLREYFFNSDTGHYVRANGPNAGAVSDDAVISLESGIQVARRSSTPVDAVVLGTVKTGNAGLYIAGDAPTDTFNLISNPFPMGSKRLDQSGLYTGNASTGLVAGTGSVPEANADLVRILDPHLGVFSDFYFEAASGKWKTGFADASLYEIPAGASAAIIRRAGRPSFTWYAPQPAMSLTDTVPALELVSAVSRKTFPNAGLGGSEYRADINLPLSGATGVESRSGGASGEYSVVLGFSNMVVGGAVNITGATAAGSPVFSGREMRINISGVITPRTVSMSVSGIQDSFGQTLSSGSVSLRVLPGDINANGFVESGDVVAAKRQSGMELSPRNIREDVNATAELSSPDVVSVKIRSGTFIP